MTAEKRTRIMAGTLSGWSMVTVGQPLDYLKTLYQVRDHHIPSIGQIYREIGLRGFYKGASSIYLFVGAVTSLQFETFERTSQLLTRWGLETNSKPSVGCLMLAGALTGTFCSFIYTPTEYAKILCQVQKHKGKGSASMIFQVLANQRLAGVRKLYTGHTITLLKQSVGSAAYYGGYYVALTKIFGQERDTAAVWTQMISGSIAGVLYQLYSYPFDTVKTNVQSGNKTVAQMFGSRFWTTANFRHGLKLSLLRSSLVDCINFTVYENLRQLLSREYQRYARE